MTGWDSINVERELRTASMTTPDRSVAALNYHRVTAGLLGLGFGIALGPSNMTLTLAREGVLALRCTTPEAAAWFRAYHVLSPMVVELTIPVMFYRCDSDLIATYGQGWANRLRRLGFEISTAGAAFTLPVEAVERLTLPTSMDALPLFVAGRLP